MNEVKICCICKKPYSGWGNNPWPVVKDDMAECCNYCNSHVVLPARILDFFDDEENE